ncbi:MAG: site-2 protease family protein [Acidobacteriota bacterium]|nr:site-2 protease family protein [Blastocatellia bacterium]MDW8239916.1 site-2 protease family protein [Acidobacteriota bacterium]
MFTQSIKLGKLLGIPVGLHYSWFIVFVLVTLSLVTQFAASHPHWSRAEHYAVGLATSVLFFVSVLLHELGHSVVALRKGVPVRAITLFVFGGVAQIEREPSRPTDEFHIAIAGPMVSFLLAGLFYVLSAGTVTMSEAVSTLSQWLGRINFMLAAFNLIPGFPLDGGRVFRALMWKYTDNYEQGTRIASASGQMIAYLFILGGVWIAFTGNFVSGLWLGFIGFFLLNAAQATVAQLDVRRMLAGIRAKDVMTTDCLVMPRGESVAELVEEHLLRTGRRCAVITDENRLVGLVTVHQIKKIPRDEWPMTPLGSIAIPIAELHAVPPDMELADVLRLMDDQGVNQVPVVSDGHVLGLLSREQMMRVIRTRFELGA